MRKFILFCAALFLLTSSFAATSVIHPPLKASEIFFSISKMGQKISLLDLSAIKVKDFEKLRGHKLNFIERLGFKKTQKAIRKQTKGDGTINASLIEKFVRQGDEDRAFHLGGFLLGFFLPGTGVVIAYFINDDHKRLRVAWAWRGLLAVLTLGLVVLRSIHF